MTEPLRRARTGALNLARLFRRSHFPEVVALVLAVVAVVIGITMVTHPETYQRVVTFRSAFEAAAPQMWGVVLIFLGAILAATVLVHRQAAAWPAAGLCAVWGAWATLMVQGAAEGGTPSAAIVYSAMSYLLLALVGVYATDRHEQEPR